MRNFIQNHKIYANLQNHTKEVLKLTIEIENFLQNIKRFVKAERRELKSRFKVMTNLVFDLIHITNRMEVIL